MSIPYQPPEISESINRLVFDWAKLDLRIIADRITDEGQAELWFYNNNGHGLKLLHTARVNLLSSSTMTSLGKRMTTHSKEPAWLDILTCISAKTMEYTRKGEPSLIIEPSEAKPEHPGYWIEPYILKGAPSVIYGDKGVNKTSFCLALLGHIATGLDSPITTPQEKANVGLLDWESTEALTKYTLSRLVNGASTPNFKLPYLRCKQSLPDDIQRVANFVSDHHLQVVLIDSLGQAAGSDKYDSAGKASALKFFECLRQLNVTSIIIAQNAKSEDVNKKTIYGSTYYTYYSRNIFELRGSKDKGDSDIMHIALFHQEGNYSKRYDTKGYCVTYTDRSITITPEDVDYAEFIERISDSERIKQFLANGSKSRIEIQEMLKKPQSQVDQTLSRMKQRGVVQSPQRGYFELSYSYSDENPNGQ